MAHAAVSIRSLTILSAGVFTFATLPFWGVGHVSTAIGGALLFLLFALCHLRTGTAQSTSTGTENIPPLANYDTDLIELSATSNLLKSQTQLGQNSDRATRLQLLEWQTDSGEWVPGTKWCSWIGLPADVDTFTGFLPFVDADDRGKLQECLEAVHRGEPSHECLFRLMPPGGRSLRIICRGQQPNAAQRGLGRASCMLLDVTKPFQEMERLRLLESAVVYARDAVVILEDRPKENGGRSALYVNAAFTEMTGYTAEEVVGRSLHFLRGPKSDQATLDALRVALDARQSFQCELLNYRKDGTELWVELSVVPVPDQRGDAACTHWVMIQRAISDRKQSEAALRHSREMLAQAQQIAHIGSWEFVPATVERHWSDERFRIFGYQPGEIEPSTFRFLDAVHPEDHDRLKLLIEKIHRAQLREPLQIEYRIVRPNGEVRYLSDDIHPELDPQSGSITRYRGATQDVTDRRQAQEQLLQAQKMELIGRMAGGIAHDFNNMLTGLIGHLELMNLNVLDPNRKRWETVHSAAVRAMKISKNLLGLARKSDLRQSPISLEPVVHEVMELLQSTTDPRITIQADIQSTARVQADRSFLHQVLLNLCVNARDAMPTGGRLTITVDELECPTVRYPQARGDYVRLTVTDTGFGIPGTLGEKIFEPFFTTKPIDKGTGLGLAMVRSIVEQHCGWVDYESTVGLGTQFCVYLPLFDRPDLGLPNFDSRVLSHTPMPMKTDTAHTILLVDDEPMIRDLARTVLESFDYQVLEAQDGYEALELFRKHHDEIQLVVLDLTMPGLSGQETYREMRAISSNPHVLFSSGYSVDEMMALDGVLGLLPKPYRPRELIQAVRVAVRGQRLDSADRDASLPNTTTSTPLPV